MSDDIASAPHLTRVGAMRVLDAALGAAADLGKDFCIVVTDPTGDPIVALRMDRAPRLGARIAADKAYSVCGFNGMPTHKWAGVIEGDDAALAAGIVHTPRLVVFGGGVPVRVDGKLVGAIGVSGGSSDEDLVVAKAGAAAF